MKQAKTPKGVAGRNAPGLRVRSPAIVERSAFRVAFMAKRDQVAAMLDAGHTQRQVFAAVFPDAAISYSQFTRYVCSTIGGKEARFERQCRATPSRPTTPAPTISNHEESQDDARERPKGRKGKGWLQKIRSIFGRT